MSEKQITAILFDLGDTIFNFGHFSKSGAIKDAARHSYEYLKELGQPVGSFWKYFIRNMLTIRLKYYWSNVTNRDFDSLETMKSLGKSKGYNLTDDQWEHLNWLWYKPLAEMAHIEPDVSQTFATLKDQGLSLGIVSNTFIHGCSLDRHLEMAKIMNFFPVRLYSCDFAYRKPDKRIFFEAANRIGHLPERILFVGDRLDTDVKGALASGMQPVLKASHANQGKKLPEGVHKIEKLSELPSLISTINS